MRKQINRITVATALLFFSYNSEASANFEGEIKNCKTFSDSLERLNCFDSIEVETLEIIPSPDYQTMDLIDFLLDKDLLQGKKLKLEGKLSSFADHLMLTTGELGADPIFVDQERVPRTERKLIIKNCDALGCRAIVSGTVGTILYQTGIIADSIEIK